MSKFQECLDTYDKEFAKLKIKYDKKLLAAVAKGCGPSLYRVDASKVSSGDPCLLYTSPSPRDATLSRMPSSA